MPSFHLGCHPRCAFTGGGPANGNRAQNSSILSGGKPGPHNDASAGGASGDALARVIRRELRRRGIEHQKVVCTDSEAMCDIIKGEAIPSISYMPGLCGLVIAGEVVRDIIKERP